MHRAMIDPMNITIIENKLAIFVSLRSDKRKVPLIIKNAHCTSLSNNEAINFVMKDHN